MSLHYYKKVLLLFGIALNIAIVSLSQQSFDSLNSYLSSLNFRGPINGRYYSTKIASLKEELSCEASNHNYLWYKHSLIVQIDGSGKIYKMDSSKAGFNRIDNTCYEGYNFGAFTFVKNDSLFSLGGYGFWMFNGMLRWFDSQNGQWYVIPTNKEIPLMRTATSTFYYDEKGKHIYVIYQNLKQLNQDETFKLDPNFYVQCLDLKSNKWWDESKILNSSKIKSISPLYISGVFHTQYGLLTIYNDEVIFLDFNNNCFLDITSETKSKIYNKLVAGPDWMLFVKENYLIFYNPKNYKADSIYLDQKNLLPTGIKIFSNDDIHKTINIPTWVPFILILTLIFLLIFTVFLLRRKSIQKVNLYTDNKNQAELIITNSKSFKENLTISESLLLNLLIENAEKDSMTSINSINHSIGIANKPLKIQNNIRAAAIQMINKKFMVYSGCNDELIQKDRTEFDKRIFEYFLQKKYISKIK